MTKLTKMQLIVLAKARSKRVNDLKKEADSLLVMFALALFIGLNLISFTHIMWINLVGIAFIVLGLISYVSYRFVLFKIDLINRGGWF